MAISPSLHRFIITAVALLSVGLPTTVAHADDTNPTDPTTPVTPVAMTVTTTAPDRAYIHTDTTLTARLVDMAGVPAEGVPVVVERRDSDTNGAWEPVATYTTDTNGTILHPFRVQPGTATLRVVSVGDATRQPVTSQAETITGQRITTTLTLTGPEKVKDATNAALHLRWVATDGRDVSGKATVFTKRTAEKWVRSRTVYVKHGTASFTVSPRTDTVWRVNGPGGVWHRAAASNHYRVNVVATGSPVRLPAGAPAPRISLPKQPPALGGGINAVVTTIPDAVWSSMVGRSWHAGCPVGRDGLRLIRMNYWGYDGYRYRGELVVNAAIAGKTVAAFRGLYAQQLPIRSMYRVDRFGWSHRLGGADDYASMAAGNTSAFNCRNVVGRPGRTSPHASGRSLDINPWENPYASTGGWVPNGWWVGRSHPRVAWRTRAHPVVATMRRHGFSWTYGTRDAHHFDG